MTPLEKTKILTDAMGWEFNLSSVEKYKARCIKMGFKARLKYVHEAWKILKSQPNAYEVCEEAPKPVKKMDKPKPIPEPAKKKDRGRPKKA